MDKTCYENLYNWLITELGIAEKVSDTEKCELIKFRILAIKFAIKENKS